MDYKDFIKTRNKYLAEMSYHKACAEFYENLWKGKKQFEIKVKNKIARNNLGELGGDYDFEVKMLANSVRFTLEGI